MGLTFSQKFYTIPETYLVYQRYSDGGRGPLIALIEVPDEDVSDYTSEEIEEFLEDSYCYYYEKVYLDELASEGYKIMQMIK